MYLLLSCLMLVIPPDQWLGYVCIQREAQDLLIDEKDSESERNINRESYFNSNE